jgi:uncharacterized protein
MVERIFRKDEVEGSTPSIGLMHIQEKYDQLQKSLKSLQKVAIAYSGGVDSVFLLKVAVDTLGPQNVTPCLGTSPSLSQHQHAQAIKLAKHIGVTLHEIPIHELNDENYAANKPDRCFHCKSHLYKTFRDLADQENIPHLLCGSNLDDMDDYRPGNRAAKVYKIIAPLMDAKLTKPEIRQLSKQLGLPTADAPASPCLASRVSYGQQITPETLKQIDQAEAILRDMGFPESRLRHHGHIARIEVPENQIEKAASKQIREKLLAEIKALGFKFVALDLQGFRSGSLNETLSNDEKQKHL